jgi:3-dehydroquinate dehydratase/shikimate dehydrogenase
MRETIMTYLAVPIAAKNLHEAEEQIQAAVIAGAELLELRTDYLVDLSVELCLKVINAAKELAAGLPIIVTCRDCQQGGTLRHSNDLRTSVLTAAVRAGADFIDVEYDNFVSVAIGNKISLALSAGANTRLILSDHNFQTKFKNITKHYWEIANVFSGAIPKLVYTAHHINDCFDILDLQHSAKGETIAFCMDEPGFMTRILTKKFNGLVSFASIGEKTATAPGQPTVEQMRDIFRWDSIDAQTEFYGVIGDPIAHSMSPAVHNACFAERGLNKVYLPLLVAGEQADFNTFMDNILVRPWLGFKGFSVTIPHKEYAFNYVKEKGGVIDPLAERIGAANTIIVNDSQLSAYNTDCTAAIDAIMAGLGIDKAGLRKMPIAVIGAGGGARAVVAGLAEAEAKIKIYNRTVERAKHLAADFKCDYASLDKLHKLKEKLIVNCTSIGMHPHVDASPIDVNILQKHMAVFDTVYTPPETLLLKHAKQTGCKTISGVDMFLKQAAEQFRLFTGHNANTEMMRKILSLK